MLTASSLKDTGICEAKAKSSEAYMSDSNGSPVPELSSVRELPERLPWLANCIIMANLAGIQFCSASGSEWWNWRILQ